MENKGNERKSGEDSGGGDAIEHETVTVGRVPDRDIQGDGVVEGLLHAVADGVVVVLGLDQRDGDIRLVVEDVIGPLAPYNDAALGEANLLADLRHLVPPGTAQSGGDELGADVAFAEASFVHSRQFSSSARGSPVLTPPRIPRRSEALGPGVRLRANLQYEMRSLPVGSE